MPNNKDSKRLCDYLFEHYHSIKKEPFFYMNEEELYAGHMLKDLVNEAINQLDYDSRLILDKDYVQNHDRNWWMEYYSKSTYYRLREKSINRFLRCLHGKKMLK